MTTTAKRLGSQPAYARPASLDTTGSSHQDGDRHVDEAEGLTKREAFAMSCMAGAMTNADIGSMDAAGCAEVAVKLADALLAELAKEA